MIKDAGFQKILKFQINKYHITLSNGLKFWSPYLRNSNYTQDNSVPRGMGKSSPDEIRASAEYILGLFPDVDTETLRKKLIDGSLPDRLMNYKGVDCSGFIYNVYDELFQKLFNISLVSILGVPKDQVLNGALNYVEWKAAYELSELEAKQLPEHVPMKWVVEKFKRKPASLCNVASLVSPYSSNRITSIKDIAVGDLVHMTIPSDNVAHIAAIVKYSDNSVELAHSNRSFLGDIGGVELETVPKTSIIETMKLVTPREFLGIYRLKGL